MKKYKVYSEELGYEETIEAETEEEAIEHGYIHIKINIHDYVDINVDEIINETVPHNDIEEANNGN